MPLASGEIPQQTLPPLPYARSRTRCALHPVPAQRASSCPRGPPPPTPPILLENLPKAKRGNTENIISGSTIGVRSNGPASGPFTQTSFLLRWTHVDAQHSPASLLAFISGKVLTLGVFRLPKSTTGSWSSPQTLSAQGLITPWPPRQPDPRAPQRTETKRWALR